jgi:hypothetical protein
VARELGVSLPRLHRALAGQAGVQRGPAGRIRLSPEAVASLRTRLGAVPSVPTLKRHEVQVLAAISRHPRGLISERQVAKAARVSPTSVGKALKRLELLGLTKRSPVVVFDGSASQREVIELDHTSRIWPSIAPLVNRAELPAERPARRRADDRRLPPRLSGVFWTGDWRDVDLAKDSQYVARRILSEGRRSPEAVAFLGQLPGDEVIRAARELTR